MILDHAGVHGESTVRIRGHRHLQDGAAAAQEPDLLQLVRHEEVHQDRRVGQARVDEEAGRVAHPAHVVRRGDHQRLADVDVTLAGHQQAVGDPAGPSLDVLGLVDQTVDPGLRGGQRQPGHAVLPVGDPTGGHRLAQRPVGARPAREST